MNLDINELNYGVVLVQYPFTNTGMVCLQNDEGYEIVNLLEDYNTLVHWRDVTKNRIEECKNVYQLIGLKKMKHFMILQYIV